MSRFKNYSTDALNANINVNRSAAEGARKQGNYALARQWEREAAQAESELAKRSGNYSPSSSGVKNVGAGAAIGAVVAGPVGAVVGGIAGLAKTIDNKNK